MPRRVSRRRAGSLVLVGSGISLAVHATLETVQAIERADTVFHLLLDQAVTVWLRQLNPNESTLLDCYREDRPRYLAYREMTRRLVTAVRSGLKVCAVFYGHPGVLVNPAHQAMRRLRREGYEVTMLPGISAEACLYADLGVNPGDQGCQSFEATNFLAFRRRIDPTSALILWQVGVLGERGVPTRDAARPERLRVLARRLLRHYPPTHPVFLYRASTLPIDSFRVRKTRLDRFHLEEITRAHTVYVPPLANRPPDRRILEWLHGS
jgi:precorrin-2 methylase